MFSLPRRGWVLWLASSSWSLAHICPEKYAAASGLSKQIPTVFQTRLFLTKILNHLTSRVFFYHPVRTYVLGPRDASKAYNPVDGCEVGSGGLLWRWQLSAAVWCTEHRAEPPKLAAWRTMPGTAAVLRHDATFEERSCCYMLKKVSPLITRQGTQQVPCLFVIFLSRWEVFLVWKYSLRWHCNSGPSS